MQSQLHNLKTTSNPNIGKSYSYLKQTLREISRKNLFVIQLFFMMLLTGLPKLATAQTNPGPQTLPAGSFIINMGVNSQTKPAGLKPYGMVYDLIKNYSVPVYWVINPSKIKEGVDFSYNGIAYRGGTFVIDQQFITPAVATVISQWTSTSVVNGKGLVVGAYTNSSLTITPAYKFTSVPKWTLDTNKGSIAVPFFTNAGIPNSAYSAKTASNLSSCDDIYVMPHADPKWATHGNLYTWNLTSKGAIWAACHAVSGLENMYNPANVSEQTNFLATKRSTTGKAGDPVAGSTDYAQNSLLLWTKHNNATPAYNTVNGTVATGTLAGPSDPVAQFIGAPDAAMQNGSEQIYLPVAGQGWRSTTRIITYDPTQSDVPGKSPGPAVAIAYGRGMGDTNRGLVMYEAGHSLDKGSTGDVPAQRAFFNFSLISTIDKTPVINSVTGIPANRIINSNQTYNFSVSAAFKLPSPAATYTWSFRRADNSAISGSFSPNGTGAASSATFTPAMVTSNVAGIITVKINDGCGRETFESFAVTLVPAPRAPIATADNTSIRTECAVPGQSVVVPALANDSDPDGDALIISAVTGNNGTWTTNGTTVTFVPATNFFGVASATYTVCDPGSLCTTSVITIGVGTPDAQGCYPGSVYGVTSSAPATLATSSGGVTSATNALGNSDYDAFDATTYAVVTTGNLVLNFGSAQTPANKKLALSFSSSSTSNVTMQVESSTDGINYTVLGTAIANNSNTLFEATFNLPASGLQFLRITRSAGSTDLRIDAAEIDTYGCVPNLLTANNDVLRTYEDIEGLINVMANDINPGNLTLTVSIIQFPVNGRISINPDNTISYLNNQDYHGTDQFRYRICNTQGLCSEGTVNIIIEADNCAAGQYKPLNTASPVTVTFQNSTSAATDVEDSFLKRDSGGNDNYGGNTTLDIGRISTKDRRGIFRFNTLAIPAGAVVTNAVFSIYRTGGENATYMLNAHQVTESWNEANVTWLWKTGSPNTWLSAGGTFDATVAGMATSNPTTGFKDFTVTSLVQAWLSGTPNNGLIIKRANPDADDHTHTFASSENGTAANRPKLAVTYVMPQACAIIPNRAPLANPDYATTNSVTAVSVPVLANDGDVDLQTLFISNAQVSITTNAGTAVTDPANSNNIRFTPNPAFNGTAVIRYRISDGSLTDEALIYVTVSNSAPVANRDNATIASGTAVTVITAANDNDPEGNTLISPVITVNPKKGSASFSGSTLTYTPAPGFFGTDTLVYQISEAAISGACNQVILSDTALVVIQITNRAPVAVNDVTSSTRCQAVTIHVLANDNDPENGILNVTITSAPNQGTAVVSGTDIIYTPNSNYGGTSVTFTYQICDNASPSLCATATVTVNFTTQNNNAPVAANDNESGFFNEQVYVDVLGNDSDPENHKLNVTLSDLNLKPANGTVEVTENNLIIYTPNSGYIGTDVFEYTITDVVEVVSGCTAVTPLSATARVTITITDQELKVGPAIYWVTSENRLSAYTDNFVVASVTDPDGPIVYASLTNECTMPAGLTLNAVDGTITVTNQVYLEAGTYVLDILTIDATGGETVSRISFTLITSALPVQLIGFNAAAHGTVADLSWETTMELNNDKYVVERSSDGKKFEEIGQIKGKGNTTAITKYTFTDARPLKGQNYYRLKQVDTNGNSSYSCIRNLAFKNEISEARFSVYPNPATDLVQLEFTGTQAKQIEVYSMDGKLVLNQKPDPGRSAINVSNLANGFYLVKVVSEDLILTQKLQKQN